MLSAFSGHVRLRFPDLVRADKMQVHKSCYKTSALWFASDKGFCPFCWETIGQIDFRVAGVHFFHDNCIECSLEKDRNRELIEKWQSWNQRDSTHEQKFCGFLMK